MQNHSLFGHLTPLIALAPQLLVYVAGGILAVAWWRRHPLASGLALGGLGLKLVASLLQVAWSHHLNRVIAEGRLEPSQVQARMTAVGVVDGLMHAVGLGLIVAAVFAGRRPAP
jgi:hypothetical protein